MEKYLCLQTNCTAVRNWVCLHFSQKLQCNLLVNKYTGTILYRSLQTIVLHFLDGQCSTIKLFTKMVPNVSTLHCYNKVYCSSKIQWIPINIIKSICIRHTHHNTPHSHISIRHTHHNTPHSHISIRHTHHNTPHWHISIRHTPLHATLTYQHSAYTITRHTHISAFSIHHYNSFRILFIIIISWKSIIEKVYKSYAQ